MQLLAYYESRLFTDIWRKSPSFEVMNEDVVWRFMAYQWTLPIKSLKYDGAYQLRDELANARIRYQISGA